MMKFGFLLVAILATTTAFSQTKNNITFDVGDIVNQEGNFDTHLNFGDYQDHNKKEGSSKSFLLNYSREVISQLQVRVLLGYSSSEELYDVTNDSYEETSILTYGLGLIYNFNADLTNTWFTGLTYINRSVDYLKEDSPTAGTDTDETGNVSTIILEVGRRFKLGTLSAMTFTWSPSLSYSMSSYDEKIASAFSDVGAGSPDKTNDFKINLLKVDAFF